jgi:phage-related protein
MEANDKGGLFGALLGAVIDNLKDTPKQLVDVPKAFIGGTKNVAEAVFDFSGGLVEHIGRVLQAVKEFILSMAKELFDIVKIPLDHAKHLLGALVGQLDNVIADIIKAVKVVLRLA